MIILFFNLILCSHICTFGKWCFTFSFYYIHFQILFEIISISKLSINVQEMNKYRNKLMFDTTNWKDLSFALFLISVDESYLTLALQLETPLVGKWISHTVEPPTLSTEQLQSHLRISFLQYIVCLPHASFCKWTTVTVTATSVTSSVACVTWEYLLLKLKQWSSISVFIPYGYLILEAGLSFDVILDPWRLNWRQRSTDFSIKSPYLSKHVNQ